MDKQKNNSQNIVFELTRFYSTVKIWILKTQGILFIGNIYMLKLPLNS